MIYTPFRQTFNGSLTYYLGCPHLNHKNICRGVSNWVPNEGTRNFPNLEEMNKAILGSIIETVPEDGHLFFLGDVIFGDKSLLSTFLDQIRPRKLYNVRGNHCLWMRNRPEAEALFDWVGDYLEIFCTRPNRKKKLCCLFHYPMKVWNEAHKRSYAITSHSHGNLPYTENELGLDVGWDVFKRPLGFMEINEIMKDRKFKPVDHHREGTN